MSLRHQNSNSSEHKKTLPAHNRPGKDPHFRGGRQLPDLEHVGRGSFGSSLHVAQMAGRKERGSNHATRVGVVSVVEVWRQLSPT